MVLIYIYDYDVKWYCFVPVYILLITNPIAWFLSGKTVGYEEGVRLQKREAFYRSLGYFQPGEELKALRARELELYIQHAHLSHIKYGNCGAYHNMLVARKKDGDKGGEATEKCKSAREAIGDAITEARKCEEEIRLLQQEIRELEANEKCEAARKTREMKDLHAEQTRVEKSQC